MLGIKGPSWIHKWIDYFSGTLCHLSLSFCCCWSIQRKLAVVLYAFFWHITVPPTSVEIVDHPSGSRVKIRENEEVTLTCKVANAKPKADIVWYRKDSQFVTGLWAPFFQFLASFDEYFMLVPDTREDTEEDGSLEGRKTVTSTIKFRPTSRDDSASYACEAQHPALHSTTMRTTVSLSVMCKWFLDYICWQVEGATLVFLFISLSKALAWDSFKTLPTKSCGNSKREKAFTQMHVFETSGLSCF